MRELDIHKMLCHKHLIRLHEIIDDETDDKVYLIIEYAPKGQVLKYNDETHEFIVPLRSSEDKLAVQYRHHHQYIFEDDIARYS